jgi:GNAT superfamily N-acetyltransferase
MRTEVEIRLLQASDIKRELFANFHRRQVVTKCRRKLDGKWTIQDDPFVDDWTAENYEKLIADLEGLLNQNGVVFGAFLNRELKGFAAVAATLSGKNREYLDLPSIHVSEDARGQGIGRTLFTHAKQWAREHGAKKLYISAHSSVETQAFYQAMGCVEAKEYNAEYVRLEPYDCQLECKL